MIGLAYHPIKSYALGCRILWGLTSFLYFYTISQWKTTNYFKETNSKTVTLQNADGKTKTGTSSQSFIVMLVLNWWKLRGTGLDFLLKIQERLVAGLQAVQQASNWLGIFDQNGGIYQLWTWKTLKMSTFTQVLTDFIRILIVWGLQM